MFKDVSWQQFGYVPTDRICVEKVNDYIRRKNDEKTIGHNVCINNDL